MPKYKANYYLFLLLKIFKNRRVKNKRAIILRYY
jgi:hypothetical protein